MIVPLNPPFEGIASERFIALARELKRQQRHRNAADFDRICEAEAQWCQTHPHLDKYREEYEAAMRILIDLTRLSWEIHENGLGIELRSPTPPHRKRLAIKDIQDDKQRVQRELEPLRNAQFQNESVREFIYRLEEPHSSSNRKSVIYLIADGRELHARLQPALHVTGEEREKKLTPAIQPYLQLLAHLDITS